MGDLAESRAYREIERALLRVRDRIRARAVAEGGLLSLAVALTGLWIVAEANLFLELPALLRCLLFYGGLVAWLMLTAWMVVRPAFERVPLERAARRVETTFPELRSGLINAVLFARAERLLAPAFAEAAMQDTAGGMRDLDLSRTVPAAALRRHLISAGCAALVFTVSLALQGGRLTNSIERLALPFAELPIRGAVEILEILPGDAAVSEGADVPITVSIAAGVPNPRGRVLSRVGEGRETEIPLAIAERDRYAALLRDCRIDTSYRVAVGDSISRRFLIRVDAQPRVARLNLRGAYPAYMGGASWEEQDAAGSIRKPAGTTVTALFTANRPLKRAALRFDDGGEIAAIATPGDAKSWSGTFTVLKNGRYEIVLEDLEGRTNANRPAYEIVAIPDENPTVRFVSPDRDTIEWPLGVTLKIALVAEDDRRLARVAVRLKRNRAGEPRLLAEFTERDFTNRLKAALTCPASFPLPRPNAGLPEWEAGDEVLLWAEVSDVRAPGTPSGSGRAPRDPSRFVTVRLVDPEARRQKVVEALGELMKRLQAVLERQREARRTTEAAARMGNASVEPMRTVFADQTWIHAETVRAADATDDPDPSLIRAREAARLLAGGPMASARAQAEPLARNAGRSDDFGALQRTQDEVIRRLEALLAVLPRLKEQAAAPKEDAPGRDLPPDVRDTLKKLKDGLENFQEEQRKLIDQTRELAKLPVDDFTEEDKKRLDALAATEDKWSKFMKESHNELSKLNPQDFSDPQLLKEMNQIFEQVEKAADALSRKTTEAAVPVEEAGLELAQSIETNLEKWLPDAAERIKWTMEEPLGESETPMAELPHELEDIVGELMEEEEDLMEEADDVTSAWSDSMDKGAGWDALDGPISNMSAKGVTGNHLPNTSEINGRSGEGRTGQSSGEMVSDTAQGKGGRKTPTRLTPDAFLKGEIKDESKDPAGGATGGGKVGGAGGEGLEGPVPPEVNAQMKRLQDRQAELVNRAEKIGLRLKLANYPQADLAATIQEMNKLKNDLKDGRYVPMARTRKVVLKGLESTKEFVEGTVNVMRDRSSSVPKGLQDDVFDASSGVSPKGYEELMRNYAQAILNPPNE